MDKNRELKDGEPCGHPGCLNHVTHPCEECGRIGGRRDKNREFAELVGIPEPEDWMCGHDFASNPLLVLRELQRNGWFYDFVLWTLKEYVSLEQVFFWLDYYILDTTGRLRDAAIEWMKSL